MWAQLITMRCKSGQEDRVGEVMAKLHATEQPGSGLLRSITARDQKDATRVYTLVVFESEAHARAREGDTRREEGFAEARALMAEVFDGPPEFVDLDVIDDFAP